MVEEPTLRRREKKITTNVPPIMSHRAELLFLPCWILFFPCYFPSSDWSSGGDVDTGQGSAGTGGTNTSCKHGNHLGSKHNSQSSRFASFPLSSSEILLMRQRRSPLCTPMSLNVNTPKTNFGIKRLQVPFPTRPRIPKPLRLTEQSRSPSIQLHVLLKPAL